MKTLIWTRGIDDWPSDADLLARLVPHEVRIEHIPSVRLSPVALDATVLATLTKGAWDHVVFTSAHGVAFALANTKLQGAINKSKNIYTFGEATAQALARHGIQALRPEGLRTGEDLGEWLTAHLPKEARVLVLGPKHPAFDLAGFLTQRGLQAQSVICYETEAKAHMPDGTAIPAQKLAELATLSDARVCFASPSAVRGFLAGAPGIMPAAVVIGPTTEAAAKQFGFTAIKSSEHNTLDGLVKAAL